MEALVFDKKLELQERPVPEPEKGEALVKVRMAGICSTDVEITKGYMGFRGILGHEFVGGVVEEINIGCGVCESCQDGLERH